MENLTLKEQAFIREVANTLNPTEAIRRVYDLGSKGGKDKNNTASAMASENLRKPKIKENLEQLLKRKKIDKHSRLDKLADIFYDKDKRSSIAANQEIAKMLGDYAPVKQEITELKERRDEIIEPE